MSTVHGGYARLLLRWAAQSGLDVGALCGQSDRQALAGHGGAARLSLASWDEMMHRAQMGLPGGDVALQLAGHVTPMDLGALGLITMACGDLQESSQTLAYFSPILCDAYALEVVMAGPRLTMRMHALTPVRSAHLERFTLALLCRHSRWLTRHESLRFDAHCAFAHPGMQGLSEYQQTFGGALCFDAEASVVFVPAGAEKLVVSTGGESVKALLRSRLMADMAAMSTAGPRLLAEVEQAVAARLATGHVRIDDVAEDLGMSARTLQVRMKGCGLSFREMLDKVRHVQAMKLVGDGDACLVEISARLGFASQSSFARAFHRWTRMSPGAYRKQRVRFGPR